MQGEPAHSGIRIYRTVWWLWLISILNGLVLLATSLLGIMMGVIILISGLRVADTGSPVILGLDPVAIFLVVLGVLLTGLSLLNLCIGVFYLFLGIGQNLFSYIKITPNGIDYRWWPFYRLQSGWHEVDRVVIHPRLLGMSNDELLLKSSVQSGPKIAWKLNQHFRRLLRRGNHLAIPLSTFRGWREGSIALDLRTHAPHALKAQTEGESKEM